MKPTRLNYSVVLLALLGSFVSDIVAAPIGTAFTYQGRLASGTNAANGLYDFSFALFDDAIVGTQKGPTLATNGVPVTNGLFTVTLDFGSVFDGNARWLAVWVETNGTSYTALTPRQPLTPAPYAVFASSLSSNVNQTFTGTVSFNPLSGPPFTVGNSTKVVNLNADLLDGLDSTAFWKLSGNAGTTAGVNFLGTVDNQPLELKVNGIRALRLEPNTNGAPNVIGGAPVNFVAAGVVGATVSGGGATTYPASGSETNSVFSDFATIGGGYGNTIQAQAQFATISGGQLNQILTPMLFPGAKTVTNSVIAGGYSNRIWAGSSVISGGIQNRIGLPTAMSGGDTGHSIGGGVGNTINYENSYSTISGGSDNFIDASSAIIGGGSGNQIIWWGSSEGDAIVGGHGNVIQNAGGYAAIGGGLENQATGDYVVIGGGWSNSVTGYYATIPGGLSNVATNFALAAGRRAKANNQGAYVWADSTDADFTSAANNEVAFRCNGGVRFTSGSGGGNQTVSWTPGSASWSFSSDRNLKEGLATVDGKAVLDKLSRLPLSEWNYKGYAQRHIGPMAQDFHALFPLNESETTLNSADLDGVALAAIKGLNEKLQEELGSVRAENAELKTRLERLEQLVNVKVGGGK